MGGFEIALIFGLIILLVAVMYLASKIQKLHRRARKLRRIVQRLEGIEAQENTPTNQDDMGA